jgi:cytochrome c-type biogenesis protein
MRDLLVGPVLLTSMLAGVVALLAPCCVSVMLPAYLSTVVRGRARVAAATVVFAAGVATVIVPIGLGASGLSAAFQRWHTPLFTVAGLAMVAGAVAVVAGWSPKLPMPGARSPARGGPGAVYGLGVFSGIASACCAPVLVGVTVLAGATGSFPAALAVSMAYVTGMVAPLLLLSLGWDRYGQRASVALRSRGVPMRPGGAWRVPLGALLSGLLLAAMGALTIVVAATGPDMPTRGWRLRMAADLQHLAVVTGEHLRWLPGWVLLAVAALTAGVLAARRTRRRAATAPPPAETTACEPAAQPALSTGARKDGGDDR